MTVPIECVVAAGDWCGEGPLWHPGHHALYWTDVARFLVHRFDPARGCTTTWSFDQPVVALSLTNREDTLAVVVGSGVLLWRPEDDSRGDFIFRLEGWPRVRCNEAAVDPRGSLWVGTMRNNLGPNGELLPWEPTAEGALFQISPDGRSTTRRSNLGISNTLAWSADSSRLYFGDTAVNTIYSCSYDPATGEIEGDEIFLEGFRRGVPDGSAVDASGALWNCRFGGACLVRLGPGGDLLEEIELPFENPTNCAFGGKDFRTLFVTSASIATTKPSQSAGGLFALQPDGGGGPTNLFAVF